MPLIALTFDDGPNTTITPLVLEKLEKYGVPGTFFLIGENITDKSIEISKEAFRKGHEIENHSFTHPYMNTLSVEEIRSEVKKTEEVLFKITGEPSVFFRPPYIEVNDDMHENIDLCFICGLGCEDWELSVPADVRAERTLDNARDGAIILLHDMEENYPTVEALDTIIPELKKRGYEFVTLKELFRAKGVDPKDMSVVRNKLYSEV